MCSVLLVVPRRGMTRARDESVTLAPLAIVNFAVSMCCLTYLTTSIMIAQFKVRACCRWR